MQSGEHKSLGVRWNVATDQLCLGFDDIAWLAAKLEPMKRHIISIIGRFYDPLGVMSPIVIKFKMLLQELCKEK